MKLARHHKYACQRNASGEATCNTQQNLGDVRFGGQGARGRTPCPPNCARRSWQGVWMTAWPTHKAVHEQTTGGEESTLSFWSDCNRGRPVREAESECEVWTQNRARSGRVSLDLAPVPVHDAKRKGGEGEGVLNRGQRGAQSALPNAGAGASYFDPLLFMRPKICVKALVSCRPEWQQAPRAHSGLETSLPRAFLCNAPPSPTPTCTDRGRWARSRRMQASGRPESRGRAKTTTYLAHFLAACGGSTAGTRTRG